MTNEELEYESKEVKELLEKLSQPDGKLSKKDKHIRNILTLKVSTLARIKLAREQDDHTQEYQQIAMYGFLTTCEKRHPLYLRFARQRFGTNFF